MSEVLSINEISILIKKKLEGDFHNISIKGEVSSFTQATSGHIYLTLKDEKAVLNAIIWKPRTPYILPHLKEGALILAKGTVSSYPARSNYQLIISSVTSSSEGNLLKRFEQLKKELAAKGLFSVEHKKSLPFLPNTIGVVTSDIGAVFHDIIHRIKERFPCKIILYPTNVQGKGSEVGLANGIKYFSNNPVDIIILARGGGSIEDLWAFNEEVLVEAIYNCDIPVISAVGHETDYTLSDFVADVRAPTPTAAAEIALPTQHDLLYKIQSLENRLKKASKKSLADKKLMLNYMAKSLKQTTNILGSVGQKYDDLISRLTTSMNNNLAKIKHYLLMKTSSIKTPQVRLMLLSNRLISINGDLRTKISRIIDKKHNKVVLNSTVLMNLSHENTLKRGFSLIIKEGKVINRAAKLAKDTEFRIKFYDGYIDINKHK